MFPFGRFKPYFLGHMEALSDTPYQLMVGVLLLSRLPRALIIHIKERNFKKYIRTLFKGNGLSIIVQLNGGLGNQLFQYAFARSLSVQLKREFRLDLAPFATYYKADPYGLGKFNIKEQIARDSDLLGFIWLRKHNAFFRFIYHRLRLKYLFSFFYYIERTFMYDQQVSSSEASYYEGFWQTEKYFKNIEDELRKEITLKASFSEHSQEILEQIEKTNAVSLHVRRYASEHINPWHGFCSLEYYVEAINLIAKSFPNPHFFIFSDNYPWVIENFLPILESLGHPFTLVENDNGKNSEDMILMSHCKHHIIANSSFSWWGAWLNPRKDKMVIAPKKWFANAPKNDTRDLLPEGWIKI